MALPRMLPGGSPRGRPFRPWLLARVGCVVVVALPAAPPASAQPPAPPWAPNCTLLPAGNVWNTPVRDLPVRADSDALIAAIGADRGLHPDFSDRGRYGIPFNVVSRSTRRVSVRFEYASESDRVPYPIPARPRIERDSDRHILMLDRDRCRLYELFAARRVGGRWVAGSGAVWDLRSNRLRPAGWTSADAAGLPILPGLARHDEVARGAIRHALRFTAPRTRRAFIHPARHHAGVADPSLPPMGLRVRLKASVPLEGFGPQARIVLTALRDYGMILADNGSPWFISGAPDPGWDDDDLRGLRRITGADLEAVDTSGLRSAGR